MVPQAGRKAEDGVIEEKYELVETPSADYVQRTEWNVRDSDGTVVVSIAEPLSGGSKTTVDLGIRVLNVAGPRASKEPEIASFVADVLHRTWSPREQIGTTRQNSA
jgi:hypothetical protein